MRICEKIRIELVFDNKEVDSIVIVDKEHVGKILTYIKKIFGIKNE